MEGIATVLLLTIDSGSSNEDSELRLLALASLLARSLTIINKGHYKVYR